MSFNLTHDATDTFEKPALPVYSDWNAETGESGNILNLPGVVQDLNMNAFKILMGDLIISQNQLEYRGNLYDYPIGIHSRIATIEDILVEITQPLSYKADLINGLVPSNQLPSYIDKVLEYASLSNFPAIGLSSKIYIAIDTNKSYRWGGSVYSQLDDGIVLGNTISTAFRGDLGYIAYLHALINSGNPHNTTKFDIGLSNVDNTSDALKPVSTPQATAIALKENAITVLPIAKGGTNSSTALSNNKLFASVLGVIKEITSYWDNVNGFLKLGASTAPICTLDITGSFAISMTTITGNYTVLIADNHINITNGATAVTVTLPTPVSFTNREITLSKGVNSTGIVTIATSVGLLEDLSGTLVANTTLATLGSFGAKVVYKSNGTNWIRKING